MTLSEIIWAFHGVQCLLLQVLKPIFCVLCSGRNGVNVFISARGIHDLHQEAEPFSSVYLVDLSRKKNHWDSDYKKSSIWIIKKLQ